MTHITTEVRINAPKEKVWEVLADFGNIYKFNPSVPRSYATSTATGGIGATRHCDLAGGSSSIEERIVEWKAGESMLIEIYDGEKAPPFKTAFARLSVREDGEDTIASGTLEYTLKYGPIGSMMDAALVKSQFSKAWAGLFAGLKHYAETGEEVESVEEIDLAPALIPA